MQTFALALHELAMNAVKQGALSRPEGRLQVRWDVKQGEEGGAAPACGVGWDRRERIERARPYQLGRRRATSRGRMACAAPS